MRKTQRLFSQIGPEERVAQAIATLPPSARRALAEVADREDLPLVAGMWAQDDGGCLVANVLRLAGPEPAQAREEVTLDVRVLDLFPEMSSRDLNRLIVAWDEAALQEGKDNDAALRRLLRGALASAGVPAGSAAGGGPHPPRERLQPAAEPVSRGVQIPM
ncbi:MAG: hypothetical protein GEU74_07840 [Nitriliruptorales bacterium]|nr:hypothetical protein [Nitriliruptorales bacterium]